MERLQYKIGGVSLCQQPLISYDNICEKEGRQSNFPAIGPNLYELCSNCSSLSAFSEVITALLFLPSGRHCLVSDYKARGQFRDIQESSVHSVSRS